jgi:sodium-dependent dicarboxylate transporter 2/3/5
MSIDHHDYVPPRNLVEWLGLIAGVIAFIFVLTMPSIEGLNPVGQRLLAVTLLMGIFWMTQALPVEMTSLFPLILFPLLGIQTPQIVSKCYMNSLILLYFSGFLLALGVEQSGLHRRIALYCLLLVGVTPRKLILGIMLATAFLSMWMSNTAITLLMLPIGIAVVQTLGESLKLPEELSQHEKWSGQFLLSIAYAASLGGIASLIGTPTNSAYVGFWGTTQFFKSNPEALAVSSGSWIIAFLPIMVTFLLVAWFVMSFPFRNDKRDVESIKVYLRERLNSLGKLKSPEIAMGLIFFTTAILWLTRATITFDKYVLLNGWEDVVSEWLHVGLPESVKIKIDDSTVGFLMVAIMFLVVVRQKKRWTPLITWDLVQKKMPWGILLLFGGGFALSEGFESAGLTGWLGGQFASVMQGVPLIVVVLGVSALVTFLTEFTSNVATVNTLLPVLYGTAIALKLDPRLLMIPATVSASFAFMLPIATPPNAIVFGSGKISMQRMMSQGFFLNLIGICIMTIGMYVMVIPVFGIPLTPIEVAPIEVTPQAVAPAASSK